jgi:hypothetical protein
MAIRLVRVRVRLRRLSHRVSGIIPANGGVHRAIQMSQDEESPRGTVVIVFTFGALLLVGWLLLFFGVFVPRGLP